MQVTEQDPLLTGYAVGSLNLPNRVIMASLTRARATGTEMAPTEMHARYYSDRASAGLILTESVWVCKQAVGFINIPGIFTQAQIEGWRNVTRSVHHSGGRIFVQLVHSGAVSHPHYFQGELPYGPSAVNPREKVFTPDGFTDTLTPKAYTIDGIRATIADYRQAAVNAKDAGFDGIELHAQLFTLIPQFLSSATNKRSDEYGGSIENRCRLLFEILDALASVFPPERIGVKFTPAAFNDGLIKPDAATVETFEYILSRLTLFNLAFIELVGPRLKLEDSAVSVWENDFFGWFRSRYEGTIIANLGFNYETANSLIREGKAELISFGMPFIANPDLVRRFENSWPLSQADGATFYTGGEEGYTDYSFYRP
jgi:N-ethylmaleimide reductase